VALGARSAAWPVIAIALAIAAGGCETPSESRDPPSDRPPADVAALLASGSLEEAVASLEREKRRDPQSQRTRFLLGASLLELGRLDRAEEESSALVAEAPGVSRHQLLLGYCLLAAERPADAEPRFETALASARERADLVAAHLALGSIAEQRRDGPSAAAHYAKALAIDPMIEEVLIQTQKEILWGGSVADPSEGAAPDPDRRKRIEEMIERLRREQPAN
jgi:tetratricopeptide (TPR) repeat protein